MFERPRSGWHGLLARLLARSERLLTATFLLLILAGALLLWLPAAHTTGDLGFLDALFTATSAVCVTGLVVADTGRDFTPFGQCIILALIQLGGLGIMTFAAVAAQVVGGKLSFRSQAILSDTFYQGSAAGLIKRDLKWIIAMTGLLELLGAGLMYPTLAGRPEEHAPLFSAVFHSISAFCNAGFSLYSDSLTRYRAQPAVMVVIMLLIVLGGLGHRVVLECGQRAWNRIRRRRPAPLVWSLHTRVVLWMSAALILIGAAALLALGVGQPHAMRGGSPADALFQSVTARTAGFNTVAVGALSTPALLVLAFLMFVGGAPASCAGGVKTTSVAAWFAQLRAWLRGRRDVTLLGRRLPAEVVARAAIIIGLGTLWITTGSIVLALLERGRSGMSFERLLFEQVSAFGTVGLSTGITASLSAASRVWIILSMFVGRIGPLAFAMAITQREAERLRFPEERLMVG